MTEPEDIGGCPAPEDLLAYREGELDGPDRLRVRMHHARCPRCHEVWRGLGPALDFLSHLEPVEPSAGFTARVMSSVAKRRLVAPFPSLGEVLRGISRSSPAWAFSAAAHILIFMGLAAVFQGQRALRPLDPTFEIELAPPSPARESGLGGPVQTARGEMGGLQMEPGEIEQPSIPRDPIIATGGGQVGATPPVEHVGRAGGEFWLGSVPDDVRRKLQQQMDQLFMAFIMDRTSASRRRTLRERNGGTGTEAAVRGGLEYLARTQEPDGSWDPTEGGGRAEYRVGCTALALLAFLGNGRLPGDEAHGVVVDRALHYLLDRQSATGRIGPAEGHYIYGHSLATLALLEVEAMRPDLDLRRPAGRASRFLIEAQNQDGGWGYGTGAGSSDTSVTGWAVMALRLAAGLDYPSVHSSLRHALSWLEGVTDAEGRVGYRTAGHFPNGPTTLTAVGLYSRLLLGDTTAHPTLRRQARLLASDTPVYHGTGWEGSHDFYGWTFSAHALFQDGGDAWSKWNRAYLQAVLPSQDRDSESAYRGSWPPHDRWSTYGGRVYTTAVTVLGLETYYRYPRLQGE